MSMLVVLGLISTALWGAKGLHLGSISRSVRPNGVLRMGADGGVGLDPLLLRAARGEEVERVPVWMMRQAGRHMGVYRDLVKKHPTFRERSENPDLATEISLQPWRAYGTGPKPHAPHCYDN